MPTLCTRAAPADEPVLLELMRAFYAEEQMVLDARCIAAMRELVAAPALGSVFLLHHDSAVAGYWIMTFGYSLERGGRTALLDELFISPPYRRRGLATAAIAAAAEHARAAGCGALHLEVHQTNTPARALYARLGFRHQKRDYLTLPL